ncbi:MAG: NusG domain II-containing protein [bacterium]
MNNFSKEIYRLLTLGDKILISTLILCGLFSFLSLQLEPGAGEFALISVQGVQEFRKSLKADEVFIIKGPVGETKIEIAQGSIRVVDSDCPQRLCVRQGKIRRTGEIIVCMPNRISIWIEGKHKNKFDAVAG